MRAVPVCCLRRHGGSAAAQDDARCTCVLFGVTQFEVPSGAVCWVAWERARGAAAAQYANVGSETSSTENDARTTREAEKRTRIIDATATTTNAETTT